MNRILAALVIGASFVVGMLLADLLVADGYGSALVAGGWGSALGYWLGRGKAASDSRHRSLM